MNEQAVNEAVRKIEELCLAVAEDESLDRVQLSLRLRPTDLIQLGTETEEQLLAAVAQTMLAAPDWPSRCASALALMRLRGKEATPMFLAALADENPIVRQTIVTVLGCCDAVESYVAVEARLGDEDPLVRAVASWAMKLFEDDEMVQEVVVDQFRDFIDGVTADDFIRFNHYE